MCIGIRGLSVPHLKRSLQLEFGGLYWNATMSSNVFESNATNAVSDLQLNDGKLFQLQVSYIESDLQRKIGLYLYILALGFNNHMFKSVSGIFELGIITE